MERCEGCGQTGPNRGLANLVTSHERLAFALDKSLARSRHREAEIVGRAHRARRYSQNHF
jgi:hypothetical protein